MESDLAAAGSWPVLVGGPFDEGVEVRRVHLCDALRAPASRLEPGGIAAEPAESAKTAVWFKTILIVGCNQMDGMDLRTLGGNRVFRAYREVRSGQWR
jgi:hypothetical protein